MKKHPKGYIILEVILVIGMVSLIVLSVGKILDTLIRLNKISESQSKALSFAQESLEIMNAIGPANFVCSCNLGDSCSSGTCTRASDSQPCSLFAGYTSCWTAYPKDFVGQTNFYLEKVGTEWQLRVLSTPSETIAADTHFTRKLTIENALRDADGNIASAGTPDSNTKKITVKVWYSERSVVHEVALKTILTAWKNY
ncbi:MAG: hypothetical protein V1892_03725 [bacterium]